MVLAYRFMATNAASRPPLFFDGLTIDPVRRHVILGDRLISLTKVEFELLYELASHPGTVLMLEEMPRLARALVRKNIQRLRAKLGDDAAQPRWIVTRYSIGYEWVGVPRSEDSLEAKK